MGHLHELGDQHVLEELPCLWPYLTNHPLRNDKECEHLFLDQGGPYRYH